jgi:hypothetical protein
VDIAEKLLFSEDTDSCGTGPPLEPDPPPDDDGELLPQAATTRAALAAIATAAADFVTERKITTSLIGGPTSDHRPHRARRMTG